MNFEEEVKLCEIEGHIFITSGSGTVDQFPETQSCARCHKILTRQVTYK